MSSAGRAPLVALIASRIRVEEKQIQEALDHRGVAWVVVDDRALSHRIGAPAPPWTLALNRSLSATRRLMVSRLCEAWGVPVLNAAAVVATCDDKIATALALHAGGLPVPETAVALSPAAGAAAVREIGLPAVLKPLTGSWGRGVCRVNDADAVEAVLALREQLPSPQQHLLCVQQFVATPNRDVRVLVAGDRVVAAAYRYSDHWITNVARGARTEPCPVDGEAADLALRAAKAVGGGFLGVDLLESPEGAMLVNEVNCGTEFRGAGEVAAEPVADALVAYALSLVDR